MKINLELLQAYGPHGVYDFSEQIAQDFAHLKTLNEKQRDMLLDYARRLNRDQLTHLWMRLNTLNRELSTEWHQSSVEVQEIILSAMMGDLCNADSRSLRKEEEWDLIAASDPQK